MSGVFTDRMRQRKRRKARARRSEPTVRLKQRGSRSGIIPYLAGLAWLLALVVPLHWFWYSAIANLAAEAPLTTELASLTVKLDPQRPLIIGRNDLVQRPGASSAEANHLELSAVNGIANATIRNNAEQRNLFVQFRGSDGQSSARWKIEPGDSLRIRGSEFTFTKAEDGKLTFDLKRNGVTVGYNLDTNGGWSDRFETDGSPARVCEPAGFSPLSYFRSHRKRVVMLIGGKLDCMVEGVLHIALPGLEWQSMAVLTDGTGFQVAPQLAKASDLSIVSFARAKGERVDGFGGIAFPINVAGPRALERFIAGKTSYDVKYPDDGSGGELVIKPSTKNHLFRIAKDVVVPASDCIDGFPGIPSAQEGFKRCLERPSSILERGQASDILTLLNRYERIVRAGFAALTLLVLAIVFLLPVWRYYTSRISRRSARFILPDLKEMIVPPLLVLAVLALVGAPEFAAALGLPPVSLTLGLVLSVVCYAVLSLVVVFQNWSNPAFCLGFTALVGLIAAGSIVLFSLAIDGDTTHWLSFIAKHKLMFLDLMALACAVVLILPVGFAGNLIQGFVLSQSWAGYCARVAGALVPIGLIGVWAFAGSEEGLGGFQPVEFAKITIVIILAILLVGLTRAMSSLHSRSFKVFVALAAFVLAVFMGLLLGVPVLKSDYSPALITGLVLMVMFFSFLLPWAWERRMEYIQRVENILRLPLTVRYPVRSINRGLFISKLVFGVAVIMLALMLFTFNILNWSLTGHWRLAGNPEQQLQNYKEMQLSGGLGTIAQRFYAYIDLSHDPANRKIIKGPNGDVARFRVQDRDVGLQSLRSKIAVANAPCGFHHLGVEGDLVQSRIKLVSRIMTGGGCKDAPLSYDPRRTGSLDAVGNPTSTDPAIPARTGVPVEKKEEPYFVDDLISVPVVQNDFIGAYLVARFGIGAAFAVMILQSLVVVFCGVLFFAVRPPERVGTGEYLTRQFLRMALVGVATLFMLHWSIAWSNVLGLLPIMGQPMTFIAAATSHHLFMVLPAMMIIILAARYSLKPVVFAERRPPRRFIANVFNAGMGPLVRTNGNTA
ncbi:MAG: hypothetical protein R3D32_01240 [Nitratireductor sp.]